MHIGVYDRLAVIYSDGSVLVLPAKAYLEHAIEQCASDNRNAISNLARVARVRVGVVEFIDPPMSSAKCSTCGCEAAK